METQKPSALSYGVAAILTAAAIITTTHVTGWNLSRAFNLGGNDIQTIAGNMAPPGTAVQTSYMIQAP